ncbi:ATP-binding protein [Lacinutrix sp. Hel_I_90]|uniref:ATP-binding protein n=1 Tax=Lacinutrix sp. Hel_I_90 TaxID=1249999 RepID=UPI0005C860C2|nr:ATP-binding protein [Lacinutrix sp. Hel_I_90]
MSDKLKFRVSSGIKDIVGRDLITDDFIAVFEIVKNSFDANAQNVFITFEENRITIADDGKGMSLDDIKLKWLYLAFSAKKDGSEDEDYDVDKKEKSYRDNIQLRKHYAGSKGIGRFSADRLGDKLVLTTKTKNSKSIEQISVDWNLFNDQLIEFNTIDIDHKTLLNYEIKFPNDGDSGVILEIINIGNWSRDKKIDLKHSLEKLINPFSETRDFNIEIISKSDLDEDLNGKKTLDRDKVNGPIKNSILQILELKTTQISVVINSKLITTKIYDRGSSIYHIEEPNNDYPLLTEVKIDLYFLNHSAKINFKNKMGIPVVNFGSVFLFKNGFRVQPFGEFGDDSWELDQRKQQGYNRFLGTRDLFGRVEVLTENANQFKEVSSRDGGLVETQGYHQLMDAFKNKGLVRLERYVVGVLWGEGFKKRKYFGEDSESIKIAENYRKALLDNDKVSENISVATSNLGSKIDFTQIIKSLATNKEIKIVDFNKEFIDLVNDRLDEVQEKFISDLEKIAEQTENSEIKNKIIDAEKKYQELLKAKEQAEQKAEEEEKKRIEAEKKAEEEEKARKEAEAKQKKEEERRKKAELATLKKEKERAEAEVAKLKAEKKAKEEEEKRKKAESAYDRERKKNLFFNANGKDANKATSGLIHHIKLTSRAFNTRIKILTKDVVNDKINKEKTLEILHEIQKYSDKIQKLSEIVTYSDLNFKYAKHNGDMVKFITEYIAEIKPSYKDLKFKVNSNKVNFQTDFSILEISIILDNLISNASKSAFKNDKVQIDITKSDNRLVVVFSDNGIGISDEISEHIFDIGYTTTRGSGIGLYMVKDIMKSLDGDIEFIGNNKVLKGASFKMIF